MSEDFSPNFFFGKKKSDFVICGSWEVDCGGSFKKGGINHIRVNNSSKIRGKRDAAHDEIILAPAVLDPDPVAPSDRGEFNFQLKQKKEANPIHLMSR